MGKKAFGQKAMNNYAIMMRMLMMVRRITTCDGNDDDNAVLVDRHIHKVRGIGHHWSEYCDTVRASICNDGDDDALEHL